jgi:RNA polymerase sigma-70 factor (ECF subfamily)
MKWSSDARSADVYQLRRTDTEIVEGIRNGETAAARALVDKHGRAINARVWRMLGADPDHEDVVQQVFVAVLKSLPRLKDPDALPDWIGKITINTVRNELRSRRMRRLFHFTDALPDIPSDQLSPEDHLVARRGLAILESLSVEDRILFVMRFMEGAELKQIARHTGHSLATVKRRLAKARDAFLKKARRDPDLMSHLLEGMSP